MKDKKKLTISLIIAFVILLVGGVVFSVFIHNSSVNSPENVVKDFYNSLLPDYNAEELENSVGSSVYSIRFDDNGYFVDRYERTRKQIVYYYGENFDSELSDFIVSDVGDVEKASIERDYSSKYSLKPDEVKRVTFSITLSSEYEKTSRVQSLTVLKIGRKWYIYDYDAYWFAYM